MPTFNFFNKQGEPPARVQARMKAAFGKAGSTRAVTLAELNAMQLLLHAYCASVEKHANFLMICFQTLEGRVEKLSERPDFVAAGAAETARALGARVDKLQQELSGARKELAALTRKMSS